MGRRRAARARLPELLARIAEVAGEDVALAVARAFGGRQLYIAAKPRLGNGRITALAGAIGTEAAEKIAREIGCGRVWVPLGPTRRPGDPSGERAARIGALLAGGANVTETARREGLSLRYCYLVKARHRALSRRS